ncbi:MAG: hypothetical protein ABW219_17265 [Ilumatobacteraceae bacterium]
MTPRRIAAVLAVAVAVAVLGACGGDDDDGGDGPDAAAQRYVDSLIAGFTAGEDEAPQLTPAQAECVAPRWIDVVGTTRLTDAGVAPEDLGVGGNGELAELGLSGDEGNELYDAFADCGVDLEQAFIEGIAMSGGLPDDVVDCLDEQFGDDTLRRIMVTTITKGEAALAEDQELTDSLLAALAACPGATGG